MNSKRWLALFLATIALLGAAVVLFNHWVDPFGVFTHKALESPSYEMTLNPRTAQQAVYLLNNYEVKNLVVNVHLDNTTSYDVESDPLSYAMPLETTGAYDKTVRDAEPIGNLDAYLQAHPVFANYPKAHIEMDEDAITGTLESLTRIRDLCREKGVNFLVLTPPVYHEYINYFNWDQLVDFYTRLAEVTDYWDFMLSSVSFEPRYFYDETHARNCVGQMTLARIFGDDSLYIPEDLGYHVTRENAAAHWAALAETHAQAVEDYTANVPVLMYHHLDQTGNDSTRITPALFEAQIAALSKAGYTAVLPDDLEAYVRRGKALPEKPILITFDDGYLSNYTLAFPILQKYGMKAAIFIIGSTFGETEHYKDTDHPIIPHFNAQQAKAMVDSGLISIQSHTYDMHQSGAFESTALPRENILPLAGESEADYRAALTKDCQAMRQLLRDSIGETNVHVLAYPSGLYDTLTQVILLENGFDMTFTTQATSNTLLKGLPQSLLALGRHNINQAVSVQQILALVSPARG